MPLPAARGDPWWPWALQWGACWGLQQCRLHLGHKKPPQSGIFTGFGVSGNQTRAPSTRPYSHVPTGFAILSFFSRSIQTVRGTSAGLGLPMSVRGDMAESSLFWASLVSLKLPDALQGCQWGVISGNLMQIKPGWGPFVFLSTNPILLGKANTYVTSILQGKLFREILWAPLFIDWFISLGTGSK